jgi:hypothetical protein
LKVLGIRYATGSERHDVVELEEADLSAPAVRADERASAAVTRPHRSLHRGGYMAGG